MNRKSVLVAAVVAAPMLFSATGAQAQSANVAEAQQAPAPATSKAAAKKDKVVCREDKATGSRVHVNRVCMTRGEWDEMQHNINSGIAEISRNGRGPSTMGSLGPN